jgi:hypothetical protein
MSENSLDGLVNQFAVVLNAMTESESLLRSQIRRVRLSAQGHPSGADMAIPSPVRLPTGAAPAAERALPDLAPASDANPQNGHDGETAPTWASTPSPARSPEALEQTEIFRAASASPETGHRNYDYFSELDEKLTGLRQRYLE